ncbi:MAG: hypothetical protein ACM36C_16730 [Acidobacteriota bacterium]
MVLIGHVTGAFNLEQIAPGADNGASGNGAIEASVPRFAWATPRR